MSDIQQQLATVTSGFNGLDWIILTVLLLFTAFGFIRGFSREIFSSLSWIFAFLVANLFAKVLVDSLYTMSDSGTIRYLVAWMIVFFISLIVFSILGSQLAKLLRPGFHFADRLLGGAFGILRGFLVLSVITLLTGVILPDFEKDLFNDSQIMPLIDGVADWLSENFGKMHEKEPIEQVEDSFDLVEII